jgi:hypothetical protein
LAFAVAFALVIAVAFAIAVALHRVTRKSRHPERVEKIPMRAELNISVAILALIGVLGSITTQAQVGLKGKATVSAGSEDVVLNAPYSAKRHFTALSRRADGTLSREESGGSDARDSQGRTYKAGERHWTYFDGKANVLGTEMLYRIEDPVANTETRWDTTSKVVKVIHETQSASGGDTSSTKCQCDESVNPSPFDTIEKLGTKTIGGFLVEGTRSSYTVPVGHDHNEHAIVVVHESWYCPELKIVILETNDDPRSGTTRNELTDIVRGEPDVIRYRSPADYVVRELQFP